MSHPTSLPQDVQIPATSLWAKLPMLGGLLGVVGLGATLGTAIGAHSQRAMFSYLWAFIAFLSIALGAMAWVLLEHLTRAAWSVVVRRIGELTMATLPLFALLWLPIATSGMHALYPWTHENDEILARKRWFLTEPFFHGRSLAYFLIWIGLAWLLYSQSVKQDTASSASERERLTRRLWRVSAVGILLYGLTQSFAAIDWLMSMQPHWYSTIFGVYFFAGSILSFFAFLALVSMGLQRAGVLKEAITTEHYHDIGKYVFGYTVFWAYIAFSQFMLIWYANIPEETIFYLTRLGGGWAPISYALPVLHFAVPFFFFMSRHIKRRRVTLALGAAWMLVMHLVDLYWLILPNFGEHGASHFAPSWLDAAALMGVGGAFFAVFGRLLASRRIVAIADPRLPESLAHENY
ncbi:MAG: hypothetical protein ACKVPX_06605 [Myxococcaceae bacterium]